MATYYESQLGYDHPSISYAGTLIINVEGLANPIILNNITVITLVEDDYSTASTIGVMSIDYVPSGNIGVVSIDYAPSGSIGVVSIDYVPIGSIGIVSIDYGPSGIITLEVGSSESGQLLNSLGSITTSGEIIVELI